MINEVFFLLQTILVGFFLLGALWLGREALVATISLLFVIANIFVVKQMTLFGLQVTCADVYIIGAVLGFNMLQEYFGAQIARKTIWISFFISFLFVMMSVFHLKYIPNVFDGTQSAFTTILSVLPRLVAASFVAHVVAQYLRLFLYAKLQALFPHRFLVGRNIGVTIVEQAFDTILFTIIGLYGLVYAVGDVMVVSFALKCITILLVSPWLYFSRMLVHHE